MIGEDYAAIAFIVHNISNESRGRVVNIRASYSADPGPADRLS
jgi:hypothetical protein